MFRVEENPGFRVEGFAGFRVLGVRCAGFWG